MILTAFVTIIRYVASCFPVFSVTLTTVVVPMSEVNALAGPPVHEMIESHKHIIDMYTLEMGFFNVTHKYFEKKGHCPNQSF